MREELKRLVKDEEEIDAAVHDFIYRVSEAADNPVIAAVTAVDVASASVLAFRLVDEKKKLDGGNDIADALVELFILQTCKPEDFLRIAGRMMQKLGESLSEARKKVEEKEKEREGGDEE